MTWNGQFCLIHNFSNLFPLKWLRMTRNGQFCMAKIKYTLIQENFYERLPFYMDSCALSPTASLLALFVTIMEMVYFKVRFRQIFLFPFIFAINHIQNNNQIRVAKGLPFPGLLSSFQTLNTLNTFSTFYLSLILN